MPSSKLSRLFLSVWLSKHFLNNSQEYSWVKNKRVSKQFYCLLYLQTLIQNKHEKVRRRSKWSKTQVSMNLYDAWSFFRRNIHKWRKEYAWWQLLDIYGIISEKEIFLILTIVGSTGQSSSGVKASDDFRWPRREFDGALANKEK